MFVSTQSDDSPYPSRNPRLAAAILSAVVLCCWAEPASAQDIDNLPQKDEVAVTWQTGGEIACAHVPQDLDYVVLNRWGVTATDPAPLSWGDPSTLTWGFISDGITIPANTCDEEAASPSNLIAFMDGIYGAGPGGNDLTLRPWFPLFEQVFNAWGDLNGVQYIYEPIDDGAPFPGSAGVLGARADLRIGGHYIDGEAGSNILACNYYPNNGDMIIDTGNPVFYGNASGNSLRLRNVLSHEHGHGMGTRHSCPGDGTKLMEPYINLGFDGPQYDDILAANLQYGDPLEFPASADDLQAGAMQLGYIGAAFGGSFIETRSIDNNADVDWHSFIAPAGVELTIIVDPDLPLVDETYLAGAQNLDGTCQAGSPFDGTRQSDLGFDLYAPSGLLLASVDEQQFGSEAILAFPLLDESGIYSFKVYGADNAAQRYSLYAGFSCLPDSWEPDDNDWTLATGLISGSSQDHSICPADDQDWFSFYLAEPSGITIDAPVLGGEPAWIFLLDEFQNGIEVGTTEIDRVCGVDELPPGSYLVQVTEDTGLATIEGYTITLDITSCITDFELAVVTAGAGSGVVTSAPAGIDCGVDCSEMFPRDAPVVLTATPDVGSEFAGWTGDADCLDGQVEMASNLSCTATFDPATADLQVSTTDGVTAATPGLSVVYTIVAANIGPSSASSVSVTDTFPAELSCSWTSVPSGGATGNGGGSGPINETLDLPTGASVTYTATCDIDPAATGTLSNTATIASALHDPNLVNNTATDDDTLLVPEADLSITKNDGVCGANPGDTLTYVIGVANAGPSNVTAALVEDDFPTELVGCSWTAGFTGGASGVGSGGGDILESFDLPIGSSVNLTSICTVDPTSSFERLVNTATVTQPAGTVDPDTANNAATDADVGPLAIFGGCFESGGTTSWSLTVGGV